MLWVQYKALWQDWATANPEPMAELADRAAGKMLTDRFASSPISQARALCEILNQAEMQRIADQSLPEFASDLTLRPLGQIAALQSYWHEDPFAIEQCYEQLGQILSQIPQQANPDSVIDQFNQYFAEVDFRTFDDKDFQLRPEQFADFCNFSRVTEPAAAQPADEPVTAQPSHSSEASQLSRQPLTIATDGACSGNPGPGGWSAILVQGDQYREIGGYSPDTTNNRMEMTAGIEALKYAKEQGMANSETSIDIISDSKLFINGATGEWKQNANLDLWSEYEQAASGLNVSFEWVKGHSGHELNERADAIAGAFSKGQQPALAKTMENRDSVLNGKSPVQQASVASSPPQASSSSLTNGQAMALEQLQTFIADKNAQKGLLTGYAGTGQDLSALHLFAAD